MFITNCCNRLTNLLLLVNPAHGFWDEGTTTELYERDDDTPRQSFFRWQWVAWNSVQFWMPHWDWEDLFNRRFLNCIAGVSIDFLPLGTAVILNNRILITSANFLDPYHNRMQDLRVWALGRAGLHNMPYRYRVWKFARLIPKSLRPEHWHGARGVHSPRHDVALIYTWDQMYLYKYFPDAWHYAYKAFLAGPKTHYSDPIIFAGSGYEYLEHIRENYKIFYGKLNASDIVNCERYLPKWWGKFVCIKNSRGVAGVPNGGGLFTKKELVGIGCFEIRYNEDRIMVFTDLRYYYNYVRVLSNITKAAYYEYAYSQWAICVDCHWIWMFDGYGNTPYIPAKQPDKAVFEPLGK